ncbi:M23 family metallopeptidase [Zhihengliuella flava]|uniref:Murein DD-endopeptidase MepM/ murein hydrolase activator NlpD n=1 Tax=Zhihengliuella flava TaxID=1285193 RepID=A0A931D7S8_9MICC|nr:M23 family metallopeptidase [Zhihengliuella flava]MBG6085240.1 murein DD-endopeptidase MepM/ murein hydrolase activator NlpD [Zhihengliuella flava]
MTEQTSTGRASASPDDAAAEAPLRRPRGAARRRLQAEHADEADRRNASGPYRGHRYNGGLRYSDVTTERLTELATEREVAEVVELPAPRAAAASQPAAPARRFAPSHMVAAAAAVSGIALTAVWPQVTESSPEDARAKAETRLAVQDVVVDGDAEFDIELASVKGTFTKEDQLDQVMTAAAGDVTRVETTGVLSQPLDEVRITSGFGYRPNPWGGYGMVNHIGQDYGISCGTPVKAAAAGTVVQAGWAGHSGNRVRIDHGNGLETTYNHNTSLKVAVGQEVSRGEVVSLAGTTGNSTGCHLHFEVLVDGTAVDPAGWL